MRLRPGTGLRLHPGPLATLEADMLERILIIAILVVLFLILVQHMH